MYRYRTIVKRFFSSDSSSTFDDCSVVNSLVQSDEEEINSNRFNRLLKRRKLLVKSSGLLNSSGYSSHLSISSPKGSFSPSSVSSCANNVGSCNECDEVNCHKKKVLEEKVVGGDKEKKKTVKKQKKRKKQKRRKKTYTKKKGSSVKVRREKKLKVKRSKSRIQSPDSFFRNIKTLDDWLNWLDFKLSGRKPSISGLTSTNCQSQRKMDEEASTSSSGSYQSTSGYWTSNISSTFSTWTCTSPSLSTLLQGEKKDESLILKIKKSELPTPVVKSRKKVAQPVSPVPSKRTRLKRKVSSPPDTEGSVDELPEKVAPSKRKSRAPRAPIKSSSSSSSSTSTERPPPQKKSKKPVPPKLTTIASDPTRFTFDNGSEPFRYTAVANYANYGRPINCLDKVGVNCKALYWYRCPFCHVEVATEELVKKHVDSIHGDLVGEGLHSCAYCLMKFSNATSFYNHMRTHDEEKPYWCSLCDKKYRTRLLLKIHDQKYHGGSGEGETE